MEHRKGTHASLAILGIEVKFGGGMLSKRGWRSHERGVIIGA